MNQLLISMTVVASLVIGAQSAPVGRDFRERFGILESKLEAFLTRTEFNAKVKDFEDAVHLLILADDRLKSYWQDTTQQIAILERMLQSPNAHSASGQAAGFYDVKDPQSLEKQLKASSDKIDRLEAKIQRLENRIPAAEVVEDRVVGDVVHHD